MCHWPVAAETLRRIKDELDELAWELQALAEGFEQPVSPARRQHIETILRRAARRRQWIASVLEEMRDRQPTVSYSFAGLLRPPARNLRL